ncbi:X8 domain-containing protein [Hirschfeldia incana]|nr:X8 domain-containing protein [Hirschfeldia incana]
MEGGSCYDPNTPLNHASVAMNLYYQAQGRHYWNCNFEGSGLITVTDPSELSSYVNYSSLSILSQNIIVVFSYFQAMVVANFNIAITRPIQNLIISYLRYLLGSPSLTDTKRDHDVTTTLIIEHSGSEFGRENVLYSATHAYVFNKLGIHSVSYHVGELTLADSYQGIELSWSIFYNKTIRRESFELRFEKRHKDLVCNSYLPYVESTANEMVTLIPEVHVYSHSSDTWETNPLKSHSTFETIAMKEELKRGLIHDLDMFVRRKYFYDRVGSAWTRSYLLHGPPGTGKTSLAAAMAKYLNFDVYDLQLSRAVESYFNPRKLLSGVMNNAIFLVEDIDEGSTVLALSNLLSSLTLGTPWGKARIVIFTTSNKDMIDPTLLSRMNMEIYMGYCCFEVFKVLASNYLGLSHVDNDEPHCLYPDIKRLIDGKIITPAQVTVELMKSDDVDVVLEGLKKAKLPKFSESRLVIQSNHANLRFLAKL